MEDAQRKYEEEKKNKKKKKKKNKSKKHTRGEKTLKEYPW
jgi:hypothetical protein